MLGKSYELPAARSRASGSAFRPRLRLTKNLGGYSGDDTDGVLSLVTGQPELLGHYVDRRS